MRVSITSWTASLALLALLPIAPLAQVFEVEPNDPCSSAQAIGSLLSLPTTVAGSLDTPPESPDIDFYLAEAEPGLTLRVEHLGAPSGEGTLADPLLGLFDADCNPLALNDDFLNLESRLTFGVPENGRFILAATAFPDFGFVGAGEVGGSYLLTISEPPTPIGSISGRIVDAVTGEGLSGISPPFAIAVLYVCSDSFCSDRDFVSNAEPNESGAFLFTTDVVGQPLEPETYVVEALAEGFEPAVSEPFDVASDENIDIGEFALQPLPPPPIEVTAIEPCDQLASDGGICRYRVRIRNTTAARFMALGWSNVEAFFPAGFTRFQAGRPRVVPIAPGGERDLRFAFFVPAAVGDGAFMCATLWVSELSLGFFGTVLANELLFCVQKQGSELVTLSTAEAAMRLDGHRKDREKRLPLKKPLKAESIF